MALQGTLRGQLEVSTRIQNANRAQGLQGRYQSEADASLALCSAATFTGSVQHVRQTGDLLVKSTLTEVCVVLRFASCQPLLVIISKQLVEKVYRLIRDITLILRSDDERDQGFLGYLT